MPRASAQRQVNNFVGGLVTEASPLNFPPNSLSQASDVVIGRDGSISSRKPFSKEYTSIPEAAWTAATKLQAAFRLVSVRKFFWESRDVLVISIGHIDSNAHEGVSIFLFDVDSDGELSFRNVFEIGRTFPDATLDDIGYFRDLDIDFDENTMFFNIREEVYSYNYSDDTFTTSGGEYLKYRDFSGVPNYSTSGLDGNDTRGSEISAWRLYNLANGGWPSDLVSVASNADGNSIATGVKAVDATVTYSSFVPSIQDSYFASTVTNTTNVQAIGLYSPFILAKDVRKSSRPILRGKNILTYGLGDDRRYLAYAKALVDVATTVTLETEFSAWRDPSVNTEDSVEKITALSAIGGRLWYAVGGRNFHIAYSQISSASSEDWFVKCHQEADPTDPEINELVDTDGGTIPIKGIGKILKIKQLGRFILVFASNGIWSIASSSGSSFVPTDISVEKVSSNKCLSKSMVKEIPNGIIVGTEEALIAVSLDSTGFVQVSDISSEKIKSKWSSIAERCRYTSKESIEYDIKEDRIIVSSPTIEDSRDIFSNVSFILGLNVLVLDMKVGAYYEWSINPSVWSYVKSLSDDAVAFGVDGPEDLRAPMILHYINNVGLSCISCNAEVSSYGSLLSYWGGNITTDSVDNSLFKSYLVNDDPTAVNNSGKLLDTPIDLNMPKGSLSIRNYVSELEIPYDTIGDPAVDKIAERIVTYLANEGHTSSDPTDSDFYAPKAKMSFKQGFSRTYRPDTIEIGKVQQYPYQEHYLDKTVLIDKNRIPGRGEDLTIKFSPVIDNVAGYKLLGYSVDYTGATR